MITYLPKSTQEQKVGSSIQVGDEDAELRVVIDRSAWTSRSVDYLPGSSPDPPCAKKMHIAKFFIGYLVQIVPGLMSTFSQIVREKGMRGVNKEGQCGSSATGYRLFLQDRDIASCRLEYSLSHREVKW